MTLPFSGLTPDHPLMKVAKHLRGAGFTPHPIFPTKRLGLGRPRLADTGNRLADMYPSYEVLSFNGIREVFEFNKMEPIFHAVDDRDLIAKVIKALPSK
jgi:hypothetical protein